MTLELVPELGVPLTVEAPYTDLRHRLEAACNTLDELGLVPEPSDADMDAAEQLARDYAEAPDATSKAMTSKRVAKTTPAALLLTKHILDEFGHRVADDAVQIRNLVTNKLVQETENPDPRVRLKALELLGKISDVGLFAEKSEVTVTHQTTDDIKARLREKLARLVNPELEDAVVVEGEVIDVDAELGLKVPDDA
jgi:hypothetical protein